MITARNRENANADRQGESKQCRRNNEVSDRFVALDDASHSDPLEL